MCGPVAIAMGQLAGGAVSAYGSIYSAKVQAMQYKAEAQAAKIRAYNERTAGRVEAGRLEEQGTALVGRQTALYGSEGLDLSGSVADVIAGTKTEVALDVAGIRTNAENRARVSFFEADLATMNAKAAKKAGRIGAASAMIGAGVAAASTIANIPTSGAGGGASIGSPYTRSAAPVLPSSRPVGSVGTAGNIPTYGYSYYGGPR